MAAHDPHELDEPRTDCDPIWTLLPHDLSIILELTGALPPVVTAHAERSAHGPCGLIAIMEGSIVCALEVSTRYADRRREIRTSEWLTMDHGHLLTILLWVRGDCMPEPGRGMAGFVDPRADDAREQLGQQALPA